MTDMNTHDLTLSIKEHALTLGFDDCRVAPVALEADDGFDRWLEKGFHADMEWMMRTAAIRQHVRLKVPGAQSVIVLARNYYTPDGPAMPATGKVARYARRRDYHRALAKPLKKLAAFIRACVPGAECYGSVDSGPVRERVWAARAGLGWTGRHGLIIHPRFGSWFYLATVITTVNLTPDTPLPDRCGSCRACLEVCPTGAIVDSREVDARRCISYHTIENRQDIPEEIATRMDGWVFGCDICQEACPWNKREALQLAAPDAQSATFPQLDAKDLLALSEEEFKRLYAGTPVMRAKYGGMIRNARLNSAGRDGEESSGQP